MTGGAPLAPPDPMTLGALQRYVAEMVRARGFTADRNEVFILLVEELGELAGELHQRRTGPEAVQPANLAHECADLLLYLVDLANGFGLDLEPVRGEPGPGAGGGPLPTVNQRARDAAGKAPPETPEALLAQVTAAVGELAREVRKGWRGLAEPERVGREIAAALGGLFRLAVGLGIDLERAVREKERDNAARVWHY